jgi:hypothetical protein
VVSLPDGRSRGRSAFLRVVDLGFCEAADGGLVTQDCCSAISPGNLTIDSRGGKRLRVSEVSREQDYVTGCLNALTCCVGKRRRGSRWRCGKKVARRSRGWSGTQWSRGTPGSWPGVPRRTAAVLRSP